MCCASGYLEFLNKDDVVESTVQTKIRLGVFYRFRMFLICAASFAIPNPANGQNKLWTEATSIDILGTNYSYIEKRFGPAKRSIVDHGSGESTYVVGDCEVVYTIHNNVVDGFEFAVLPVCETGLGGNWLVGRARLKSGITFADLQILLGSDDAGKFYATCLGNCAFLGGNAADPIYGLRYDSGARTGISIDFDTDYESGDLVAGKWEKAIRARYGLPDFVNLPLQTYECPTPLETQVASWFGPLLIKRVTVSLGRRPLAGKCDSIAAEVARAKRQGRDYEPELQMGVE